jgi:hypothetical protein
MLVSRRISLLAAAAVAALGMLSICTSATASAASSSRASAIKVLPEAKGSILCYGDLCLQTDSVGSDSADVETWANNHNFTGHFEMIAPGGQVFNSPTETWKAGGKGYEFENLPLFCGDGFSYEGTAWQGSGSGPYNNLGSLLFGIDC